jgi:thiol-disulfide isomerase/thioredoxin
MKKVIKFWTPLCSPCKVYASTFDKIVKEFGDQVEFVSIDIKNDITGAAAVYKIRSVPCTVIIKDDGTEVKESGIIDYNKLKELILS